MKRTPLNKTSKLPISKAKKLAWQAFSLFIRTRDNWTCYTCGTKYAPRTMGLHAGHFISRVHLSTFLDEMNVHGQCAACNLWKYGEHGKYAENLIRDFGVEEFQKLLARGREIKKYIIQDYLDIKELYEKKLKELSS